MMASSLRAGAALLAASVALAGCGPLTDLVSEAAGIGDDAAPAPAPADAGDPLIVEPAGDGQVAQPPPAASAPGGLRIRSDAAGFGVTMPGPYELDLDQTDSGGDITVWRTVMPDGDFAEVQTVEFVDISSPLDLGPLEFLQSTIVSGTAQFVGGQMTLTGDNNTETITKFGEPGMFFNVGIQTPPGPTDGVMLGAVTMTGNILVTVVYTDIGRDSQEFATPFLASFVED